MGRSRRNKRQRREKVTLPEYNGDHGPQTAAQMAGAEIVELVDSDGKNPNRIAQKRRENVLERMHKDGKLSLRQYQAGCEIQEAYCQLEMLSSGSPLSVRVDSSAKPDKFTARQADAQTRLNRSMEAVPKSAEPVVNCVCRSNLPIKAIWSGRRIAERREELAHALDLVADCLKY